MIEICEVSPFEGEALSDTNIKRFLKLNRKNFYNVGVALHLGGANFSVPVRFSAPVFESRTFLGSFLGS